MNASDKRPLIASYVLTTLVALFLAFDSVLKVLRLAPAVQGTTELGYPAESVFVIGVIELACLVLYLIPRTSVSGALLLTGYLGGAIATHVRLNDSYVIPVILGIVIWAALYLRDVRLRALVPLRK